MFFRRDAIEPGRERRAASIAVAPFDAAPLDADQARLATGFLEDVIGELARFPALEVLAARTSLALSREDLEPRRMAEAYGVTHLLDTSVRQSGDTLRVKASLVETASGQHLWTQTYDVPATTVSHAPDDLAAEVANHLSAHINLTRLTRAKARPLASLEVYDLWLRGREAIKRGTCETDAEARELFERALAIDPTYARAYAGLSLSHFNDWSCQRWNMWEEGERLAFDYAAKAEALDSADPVVQLVLGRIQVYRRNFAQGRRHLERVTALAPNDADCLMTSALWWGYLGDDERALAMADKAFRLNPLHEPWYYVYAGLVCFLAGDLDEALRLFETSPPHMMVDQSAYMAAVYALTGRPDDARRHVAMFHEVFREKITFGREPGPDEPVSYLLHVNPFSRDADRDRLVEGLRLAGVHGQWDGRAYLYDDRAEEARFASVGGLWEAAYAGRTARVPDMKGCRDLALLLASPRERIHCMEIAGRVAEGDCGAVMDARARAECQGRIRDLQAELAEAERDGDLARSERLGAELDALIDQLAAAMGLGGRGRKLGDPAEKARTAVTWRIRNAIRKIGQAHPELGRHLEASIRTGAFCVYAPENPVRWAT